MGTSPRPSLDMDKLDEQIVVYLLKRLRYTAIRIVSE